MEDIKGLLITGTDIIEELTIKEIFNRYKQFIYNLEGIYHIAISGGYLFINDKYGIVFPNAPELYENWEDESRIRIKTIIRKYNISKL